MNTHSLAKTLIEPLDELREAGMSIGLVPTMGALHSGHISLITRCASVADEVVCSIFVNPTQFNEATDLEKYPRTEEKDAKLLNDAGCNFLYLPEVADVYPENHIAKRIDYRGLDLVMEGKSRPGHFDGVVEVVARLFDLVCPDFACFGEKDFQQLAVIRQLVLQHNYPIEIIPCPIIRENNGLAMSSRNERLSAGQREQASVLHATLREMKDMVTLLNPDELASWGRSRLQDLPYCELEYLEVAESETLGPIFRWHECESARAFVVARFGDVRLIDNMEIYSQTSSS